MKKTNYNIHNMKYVYNCITSVHVTSHRSTNPEHKIKWTLNTYKKDFDKNINGTYWTEHHVCLYGGGGVEKETINVFHRNL